MRRNTSAFWMRKVLASSWNPGNTRLMVLFDPGRIKRGLLPLNESGPHPMEGRSYTLAIDGEWKEANGQPLGQETDPLYPITTPGSLEPPRTSVF